jgi:hypothetical protein
MLMSSDLQNKVRSQWTKLEADFATMHDVSLSSPLPNSLTH